MLLTVVAFAAAQVSGATASVPTPPQAAAASAETKKKKRVKYQCDNTQMFTGSHLIPCEAPDPHELELQQMRGAAQLRFSPSDGSSMSNESNLPRPR